MRIFDGLRREAHERRYWAEDDWRAGLATTTLTGFWVLAFFGRIAQAAGGRVRTTRFQSPLRRTK